MYSKKNIRYRTDTELTQRLGAMKGAFLFIPIAAVILVILVDGMLFKLVIAALLGLLCMPVLLERKRIKAELLRRYPSTSNMAKRYKGDNRIAVKVFLVTIAICVVVCGVLIMALTGSDKDGCRNCGRDVPLVSGFGYCADCYEGFTDWQKENWTKGD